MKIFITGASSGIGKAITNDLLSHGHKVIGIGRRSKSSLPKNKNYNYLSCDINNQEDMKKLERKLTQLNFYPDIVILGAGISEDDLTGGFNKKVYQEVININLMGAIKMIDLFLPMFLKVGSGQFIALSSISAFRPNTRGVSYSASKAALSMTFRGLDLKYRNKNIFFSNIYLGPVKTKMWEGKKSFLVASPEKIARKINNVIKTKKAIYFIPFFSTFLSRISNFMPDKLYTLISNNFIK